MGGPHILISKMMDLLGPAPASEASMFEREASVFEREARVGGDEMVGHFWPFLDFWAFWAP